DGGAVEPLALVDEAAGQRPSMGRVLAADQHHPLAGEHDEGVDGGFGVLELHHGGADRFTRREGGSRAGMRPGWGGDTLPSCPCSSSPPSSPSSAPVAATSTPATTRPPCRR